VWDAETLAGDHDAADRIIAEGYAAFAAMGKPHRMLGSFLALSQIALGRAADVERLETIAADKRQATRALLEHAIAAAYLSSSRLAEAERYGPAPSTAWRLRTPSRRTRTRRAAR
jgi:hypothetical protein